MPNFFKTTLILLLSASLLAAQDGPKITVVKSDQRPAPVQDPKLVQRAVHPWKKNITATVFWIGEKPTQNNPTPNNKSSWDTRWEENYGGYDDPEPSRRESYRPKTFTPGLNPFYIALPYNDVLNYKTHRPEASRVIPWFKMKDPAPGKTVLRGRWVQIYANRRFCYAQWEDCGPFVVDDWEYVFGNQPPKNNNNKNAGIDISPAVRDFLGLDNTAKVHWRFVEFGQIPRGPWSELGSNNPFVNNDVNENHQATVRYMEHLRKMRDRSFFEKDVRRSQ